MKIALIKRWKDMAFGNSAFNVKQGVGQIYSKGQIKGYYNDLTNKVLSNNTILDKNGIPTNKTIANVQAYFPITIFQYGLGLYDLFLKENDEKYKKEFLKIVGWTIDNQKENGMWNCMETLKDSIHDTQSSMCQGEAVSLLLRAYKTTGNEQYLISATKAIDFMIKDIKDGGTAYINKNEIIFQEYVSKDNLSVLNGWIFSIFGLYDYTLVNKEKKYNEILEKTLQTLIIKLKEYDRGYWSNYDLKGTITSPAYHNLHIQQLNILYELFGKEEFRDYAEKWKKYGNSKINLLRAVIIKLKQKLIKNNFYDINTSLVE